VSASLLVSRFALLTHEEGASQKSEDNLVMAELELEKHTTLVTDLTRKVDELQVKDQLDE